MNNPGFGKAGRFNIQDPISMRAFSIKIIWLLLLPSLSSSFLYSQVSGGREQITDTIRCRDAAGQSYALFRPAQYDKTQSWPVILIFDPSGRGRTGIDSFTAAGRKYRFILACSNNSRNGPMSDNFAAAAAMLRDLEEKFNIDQKRIYAAGFSGGSRFAMALAVKEKRIAGVIGCGAGIPNDRNYMPGISSGFLYYGLAGSRDMNFPEMHELPAILSSQSGVIPYLRTFDGEHQWPGSSLLTEAVEWLLLQSMNRNIIAPDKSFISFLENKTQNLIDTQLNAGNLTDAVMYMKFASRDFQGTPFGAKMDQHRSELEKSDQYRTAVSKWNKMAEKEQKEKEKYLAYLGELVNSASLPDSASGWWKRETGSLLRLRSKGSPGNSMMASRVLNFLSILCYEQGASYYRNHLLSTGLLPV